MLSLGGSGLGLAAAAVMAASAASASAAATVTIHKVSCTGTAFTVYYEANAHKACYAGIGTIRVSIPDVDRISTGDNSGRFVAKKSGAEELVTFRPRMILAVSGQPTMLSITISAA